MSVNFESVLNFIRSKDKNINFKLNSQDDLKTEISDVISDSREVKNGTLFCCIKGEKSDGHEYAKIAENSGACAFLCEREIDSNLPQIIVKNVREFLGEVS
ncbi:MAG: hypothetical protein IJJ09_02490, partial [Synergistaceae bacterium]|nr:hypothetical protein [Synergistaceae bacterium]